MSDVQVIITDSGENIAATILTDEQALSAGINPALFIGPQGVQGETGDSGVFIGDDVPLDPSIGVWVDTSETEGLAATKISTTLTLAVANWNSTTKTQTVSVPGLLAPSIDDAIVSPVTASREAYNDAGVYCSTQAAGSLTFACDTVPTAALTVNLLIVR